MAALSPGKFTIVDPVDHSGMPISDLSGFDDLVYLKQVWKNRKAEERLLIISSQTKSIINLLQ